MASTSPEYYCSTVQTTDSELWFVSVEIIPCLNEPGAIEEATVNIGITDGVRGYMRQGLTSYDLGSTILNRMRHALEALVQFQEPTENYILRFNRQSGPDELFALIEWDNKRHGKDTMSRIRFQLEAADRAECIKKIMGSTLTAINALKQEASELEASCLELQKAAEADNKTLEEYASRKEELDGDLALKSAALLATKQSRLAELLKMRVAETQNS